MFRVGRKVVAAALAATVMTGLLGAGVLRLVRAEEKTQPTAPTPAAGRIVFEDFTEKSCIRRLPLPKGIGGKTDPGAMKPGVVYWDSPFDVFCGELDGDGHMDILSADHHPSAKQQTPGGIWLGKGDGTFGPNVLERASIEGELSGIGGGYGGVLDIDGDGRMDFFCSEQGGVYLNGGTQGAGETRGIRFTSFKCGGWRGWIFGDFDRDGKLDAATGAGVYFGSGKGTHPAKGWKPSAQAAEAFKPWEDPLHSSIAADFRRSQAMDILCGQCIWRYAWNQSKWEEKRAKAKQPRGLLYVNDGKGNFTESAEPFGLAEMSSTGPLVAADFNSDGYFDVFSVGLGNPDKPAKARLHVNEGGKHFTSGDAREHGIDITSGASGIPFQYCCASAVDLDNDGLIDLIVGDGPAHRVRAFRNLGNFRFEEVEMPKSAAGTNEVRFAVADFNEDGLADLALNGGPNGVRVFLNRSETQNGWLELTVRGTEGNPCGIGALVEVFKPGRLGDTNAYVGMQHVLAENHNHIPLTPHFGLGRQKSVDVRVTLPTGQVLEAKELAAGTRALADFTSNTVTAKQEKGR